MDSTTSRGRNGAFRVGHCRVKVREKKILRRLYTALLEEYAPQGWWPLLSLASSEGFDARGYHAGSHEFPRTREQRFEVILGAILTQNTAWTNVEKALRNLRESKLLTREALQRLSEDQLAELIRPSGYFRQKARKIRAMLEFLASRRRMTRDNLLRVWGVGPETADSILLYACHRPFFVVDAYTTRILEKLGMVANGVPYEQVQALFHEALPRDVELFNEFHALIVAHAKRHYTKKPYGGEDPLVLRLVGTRTRRA